MDNEQQQDQYWVLDRELRPHNQPWRTQAACLHLPAEQRILFYGRSKKEIEQAKQICNTQCPVKTQCYEWAIAVRDIDAVLGGSSADDRLRLFGINRYRRKRRLTKAERLAQQQEQSSLA